MNNETFELAEYETPVPVENIPTLVWSVEKYKVAQMLALQGKSRKDISLETKVPLATIDSWRKHPDFQAYIASLIDIAAATMKRDNISLMRKVVDARIAEAEKSGDYASLSKKDTLEIIKELNIMTEDDTKKEESNYAKLLEKLVIGSMPKTIIHEVHGG